MLWAVFVTRNTGGSRAWHGAGMLSGASLGSRRTWWGGEQMVQDTGIGDWASSPALFTESLLQANSRIIYAKFGNFDRVT